MTTTDHAHNEAVVHAADYLAQPLAVRISRPIVPLLRERFGLTTQEAIEAIRLANDRRQA